MTIQQLRQRLFELDESNDSIVMNANGQKLLYVRVDRVEGRCIALDFVYEAEV